MSIESIGAVTISSGFSSDPVASPSALPRTTSSDELPKIEFKSAPDELQKAIDAANHMFEHVRPDIKFVIDEGTNDVVIMLVEPETGAVINRYPTEQALAISNAIVESQARLGEQHEVFQRADNQLLGLFVQQNT